MLNFKGFLVKDGQRHGPLTLSLTGAGNEYVRVGRGQVTLTDELRKVLFNPMSGLLFEFQSVCGASFNVAPIRNVNLMADTVMFETSGQVPGL